MSTGLTAVDAAELRPDVLRELFDLQGSAYAGRGGGYAVDLNPQFNALRASGPVHVGTPGQLIGYTGTEDFFGLPLPDRPHVTVFDYDTCKYVVRKPQIFSSNQHPPDSEEYRNESMILFMDGVKHRRMRGLVARAFQPANASWWMNNWITDIVDSLIDLIADRGRADLNVEYFAPIPLLTICRSFGVSVSDALEIRRGVLAEHAGIVVVDRLLKPIIRDRRENPQDDLISVLVSAELEDEDTGEMQRLTDDEVFMFSFLLLAAGSGTTWKQLGITMHTLLRHPEWLARVREEPDLILPFIEETMRWLPTDPVFSRFATEDTELHGVEIAKGTVVHLCFASANRDPEIWDRPDEFDPDRDPHPHMGFGAGSHVCLGQHIARAEIREAITALVTRLPGLRLDPDVEPPRITGLYERGPTAIPVVWDAP